MTAGQIRRGIFVALLLCLQAQGQEATDPPTNTPSDTTTSFSLAKLAETADLIAIVRVEDTYYEKIRSFPSKGQANLRVLIPYQGSSRGDLVVVTEEGLAADACYYPEVGPFVREGQRFLVFLNKTPKSSYRGRAPGCRIPVLVTDDAQYAMIYPIPGVAIADLSLVEELTFSDPAAFVDATESTFAQLDELINYYRARLVEADSIEPGRAIYVYTRGIPISKLRAMLSSPTKD